MKKNFILLNNTNSSEFLWALLRGYCLRNSLELVLSPLYSNIVFKAKKLLRNLKQKNKNLNSANLGTMSKNVLLRALFLACPHLSQQLDTPLCGSKSPSPKKGQIITIICPFYSHANKIFKDTC